MNINEKFFRVEKLKFLAPLTRLLGQRELRTRCCPERPKMTFKHFIGVYYMNISHVGPLWGLFRYPRGAQKGPFGLKKTLTGRKASEHPRGARFGPNCCQLVWLSWNHGYHTLWPCIGPLLGPQGHQTINLLVWSHVIHFYCFQASNSILGCFLAQGWILGCLGTLICNKASEPIFSISLVLFAPRGSSLVCFWLLQPKTGQKLSKNAKKGQKWVWTNGQFLKKHTLRLALNWAKIPFWDQ